MFKIKTPVFCQNTNTCFQSVTRRCFLTCLDSKHPLLQCTYLRLSCYDFQCKYFIFCPQIFFKQAMETLMKFRIMRHFIRVFIACKRWQLVGLPKTSLRLAWLSPDILVKGGYYAPVICIPPLGRGISGPLAFQFLKPY